MASIIKPDKLNNVREMCGCRIPKIPSSTNETAKYKMRTAYLKITVQITRKSLSQTVIICMSLDFSSLTRNELVYFRAHFPKQCLEFDLSCALPPRPPTAYHLLGHHSIFGSCRDGVEVFNEQPSAYKTQYTVSRKYKNDVDGGGAETIIQGW